MTAKQRATRRLAHKAHRAARIAESGFRVSKQRKLTWAVYEVLKADIEARNG